MDGCFRWRLGRAGRGLAWAAVVGVPLLAGGCAFPGPQTRAEQDTLQSCRADADRAYAAQNRYQLSERDTRDTPFSGSGQPTSPSDGLADEYSHEVRVDNCVRRGDSEVAPSAATAPAASVAHGVGNSP